MGRRNKQLIHMESLVQACRDPSSKNEDLDIIDDEPKSGDGVLDIYMESFSSVIQSNLNNHLLYCSVDSDSTN